MDIPLLAPVEGCTIECIAVDRANTKVRDDGFRITKRGSLLQVDMVTVIPPRDLVEMRFLWNAMESMAIHATRNEADTIFRPHDRKGVSLSRTPQDVIVVTHLLRGHTLLREEVNLSKATVTATTYEEYSASQKFFLDRIDVMRAVTPHPSIKRHLENYRDPKHGAAQVTTIGLLELFNLSCRTIAHQLGSPFVSFVWQRYMRKARYEISRGRAIFNCGLRDPCACINAMNLAHRLQGKEVVITAEHIRRNLPDHLLE